MTRPDDLADLFAPLPAVPSYDLRYRQGVIVAWNPLTAENTVLVGGTLLTDLAVLNTSEALLLSPGDVVGIACVQNARGAATWAILGRFTIPGTEAAASALRVQQPVSASVADSESTSSTTYTDLNTVGPEVTARITAGRALVILTADISLAAGEHGRVSFAVTGATTQATDDGDRVLNLSMAAGASGRMSSVSLATDLVPGDNVFTAKYRVTGAFTVDFSNRNITVIPF